MAVASTDLYTMSVAWRERRRGDDTNFYMHACIIQNHTTFVYNKNVLYVKCPKVEKEIENRYVGRTLHLRRFTATTGNHNSVLNVCAMCILVFFCWKLAQLVLFCTLTETNC